MAAAVGYGGFVEFRMKEQRAGGALAARRRAVNSHAADVVIGIFGRDRLVPENAVGKSSVFEAVHLHQDKTQIRQRGKPARAAETFRHERTLRAGVDLLEDGVFLVWIEVAGTVDDAPDVGLSVAALGHKDLGRFPPAGF